MNNKKRVNVLVVADGHYYVTPSGEVYADSIYDYNFYARYLQGFDHVYAVVRAKKVDQAPKGKKRSDGVGVSFFFLPTYQGPYEYVLKYYSIIKSVKSICTKEEIDCAIFRIPSATGNVIATQFKKTGKYFAVEVVTDPWENFGPRTSGNKLMLWIVRRLWTKTVRSLCASADGASYVTECFLQERYPSKARLTNGNKSSFESFFSSVELPDEMFAAPRVWNASQDEYTISHVSNYFNGYEKGHLVLMKALKKVIEAGYKAKVVFVGDGPLKGEFIEHAKTLGIIENVSFVGRLANGNEVRTAIRKSDVFILPTYAEGLPRVLLEAMAEGIPCLSSPVCGIPEIIDNELLYDFDDVDGFAKGIIDLISSPEKMTAISKKNVYRAMDFSASKLNKRRKGFYLELRKLCEE